MMENQDVLSRLGGRKFVAFVLALVTCTLAAGLMPGGLTTELASAIVGLVAVFSGANAMSTIQAIKGGASQQGQQQQQDSQLEPPPAALDNAEQLDRIEAALTATQQAVLSVQQLLVKAIEMGSKSGR